MTATDKRSLISESVAATRINIHPAGEEPDQHVICVALGIQRTTTVRKAPTKSKSNPCSRDEVLAPSDRPAQPSSWAASFSLQQTTMKQRAAVRQSSYWAIRFTGPHKIRHAVSINHGLPSDQNGTILNSTHPGATTLEPQNSHDLLPALSF
jgi:hypothetical protein